MQLNIMGNKLVLFSVMTIAAAGCSGAAQQGDEAAADWQLVWQDDFDGAELDRTKWSPEESCWGGGNNERQCYTDREENIAVSDSMLHLKARQEEFTGPLHPEERRAGDDETRTQQYTSGKVRTRGLADWKYGRFSARIKLPAGQGTWPAFWMMPADSVYGKWPLSGEIDIMEAVNLGTPCEECEGGVEARTSGALHFGGRPPENTYWYNKTDITAGPGPHEEFRVYTVEWAEGVIQWFVDGDMFMRIEADDWYTDAPAGSASNAAPFDKPFYLMLNLAVGGKLPEEENGMGFDPESVPADMLVDWVRVEQCSGDETGLACLTEGSWSGELNGPWEERQE